MKERKSKIENGVNKNTAIATACIHHAEMKGDFWDSIVPPIFETVNFYFHDTKEAEDYFSGQLSNKYYYTRGLNPTVHLLEKKLAAIEGTPACKCFGSGMAAVSAAILGNVQAGDHIISVGSIYKNAYRFLTEVVNRFGIDVTFVEGKRIEDFEAACRTNTKVIYLESPSSTNHSLQDLSAVAEFARAKKIITIIDNALSTPYNQRPYEHGIDLIVHSVTKYLNGHGDVLAGAVCGSEQAIKGLLSREHALFGGILGPFEAWLVLRGLRTFAVRMKYFNQVGLEAASFLEKHPKVARVYYPLLPSHPQYELAKKQMSGGSAVLTIELKSGQKGALTFINNLKLFRNAASWGSFESLVWYPLAGAGANIKNSEWLKLRGLNESLIRLSIGMEDVNDIKEDIEQALKKC